ncbi:MAG: hypothetical protein ABW195_17670, partial [Ilumatobacteraceae bacterium]
MAEGVEVGDQASRTASRSGTGTPSRLASVRATVLAPAAGTRSSRQKQSTGSPRTTSSWYGGSSTTTSPIHVATISRASN